MKYFGFDKTLGQLGALKRLGFGQSGIEVDFVAGTYSKDGVSKTFDDLFTFSRAGKAWLVKESGLQEFAANVPRFDNGLLIEKSATNLSTYSAELERLYQYVPNTVEIVENGYRKVSQASGETGLVGSVIMNADISRQISVYIKKTATDSFVTLSNRGPYLVRSGATINTKTGSVVRSSDLVPTVEPVGNYYLLTLFAVDGGKPAITRITSTTTAAVETAGVFTAGYLMQAEVANTTSYVHVAGAAAVTRPADYLSATVTGTTVSGDWDSTLTLSIVDGQLKHSGYGRIRSLEIY